jgi:hypothetical protein
MVVSTTAPTHRRSKATTSPEAKVRATKMPPKPQRTAAIAEALRPRVERRVSELMRYRRGHTTVEKCLVHSGVGWNSSASWKVERRMVLSDVPPPTRDSLTPRIEAHAVGSVDVQVTEERAIPAAEGVVGDGNRNGNVNSHHARVYFSFKTLGRCPIAGEDSGTVAVPVAID